MFSIVFVLVLVGLGLVTAVPILADVSPGWMDIDQVGAGAAHTVGVKDDGTVVAVGYNDDGQCEVGWTNIKQVAAGYAHTVGVKNDGTMVAVGDNEYGQCEVGNWTVIVQVAAGARHTVGVKGNDTAVAVGRNDNGQCNVGNWTNITQVAAGAWHTVGLRSDGTVVAVGSNGDGQCNVAGWTNITQVAAGDSHTVGLRSDGTVVAVGYNDYGQCSVGGWTNITQIAAGGAHTVGLRADGTAIAVGNNGDGQCNVAGWTDITQVAAGRDHTVGVRSGGTVVAIGDNTFGQCGGIVTERIEGYGIVNAIVEADAQVVVTGNATVTIFEYASNPHPGAPVDGALASLDFVALSDGFKPMNIYPDVRAINITPGTEIEIRLYYTAAEVQGFNETSVRLFWHNGAAWVQCSPTSGDSGVNTSHVTIDNLDYSGYMWAKIRTNTTPSLADLQGTEFGGYGHPSPTDGDCFIGTAAYGTDTAKELDILREFRDTILLPNSLGDKLVTFYYRTSPPIASVISQHEVLRTLVRVGFVDPIVRILRWAYSLWSTIGP
jgi:alpha-tubulin suppressor-like RCC1 family protein